jgi:hypothetical protein
MHRRFASLTADLAQVTGDFPQKMLCPLCLTPIPEEWIDSEEPRITEEHIIPEMLGGRPPFVTLTCKDCNSTHGAKLDSHLIQMIRAHDSLAGVGTKPLYGRMHLAGKSHPIDINFNAATKTLETKMRRGHPAVPTQVREFFTNNPGTLDNPITIKHEVTLEYIPDRANLALLRIGYLAIFKQLRYRYILSSAVDVIRQIIMKYETPPIELRNIVFGMQNISPAPAGRIQFYSVKNGVGILVVMTLVAGTKQHYYGTIMPNPDLETAKVFQTLSEAAASIGKRHTDIS